MFHLKSVALLAHVALRLDRDQFPVFTRDSTAHCGLDCIADADEDVPGRPAESVAVAVPAVNVAIKSKRLRFLVIVDDLQSHQLLPLAGSVAGGIPFHWHSVMCHASRSRMVMLCRSFFR